MIDLLNCKQIEFIVDSTGKVWVNLDGRCVVRVGKPEDIHIEDKREKKK